MISYQNGNTNVTILADGTKTRVYENIPEVLFPESIDVKISDYCDLGCRYCHESSTKKGEHGDLNKLLDVIKDLPAGVELAIGGGNPLSHPDIVSFLTEIKRRGLIANITVNQGHIDEYFSMIEYFIKDDLVKGVGISVTSKKMDDIKRLKTLSDNIVYHVIAGVNKVEIVDELIQLGSCKVLVLGYKQFGFGVNYYNENIEKEIKRWYMYLPKYVGKCILSFDNLAIEQLNIKRLFTDEGWDKFFMGQDFCFTMYIDAVKQEYAPTSRSADRKSFKDYSLLEYFQKFKK